MPPSIADLVRNAGVVGAGGAGFPTWAKLSSRVDTCLVNAAECEPLLYKDKELCRLEAKRLVDGLRLAMEATGATRGIVCIKEKAHDAIRAIEPFVMGPIHLHRLGDFYPAGDEVVLVFEVTGRLVPPGGLPLHVGCLVNNVETLVNVSRAAEGIPVTTKALTITGAVAEPASFVVPLGISVREVLEAAGGATVPDGVAIEGGAMMGRVVLDAPVTRTTGGYVVLDRSHALVRRLLRPDEVHVRIARSACDQCAFCTELCPRYLLGYAVEPHKVMRSVGFAGEKAAAWNAWGLLCCECGLCDLFACPEDLPPRRMCVAAKAAAAGHAATPPPSRGQPHPLREARRVPTARLVERLGLAPYDRPAPMRPFPGLPSRVFLPFQQHVGVPAAPVVRVGDRVRVGQVVAAVDRGALGVDIHASIDGRVTAIEAGGLRIERE
ncbi:MAG: 4Fe-4S dicluster domain-containing protein [Deltaproteobacteria bacterium]|nr:4Fe-4S dicluster domain-containing protein [Deltaproteobacteria bacterium]